MALPAISRERSQPRFSQDSAAAPVQFSADGARQYNEWRAANPEKAAWLDRQWGFNWKDLLVLGIPVAGAVAAAALAPGAAAAGGTAAGGTGIGTGTATGLGSGVGLGLPGAGASLPIGGAGGAGLLAGTPGVSAASLFGGGAAAAGGAAATGGLPAISSIPIGTASPASLVASSGAANIPLGGAPGGGFWSGLGNYLLGRGSQGGTTGRMIDLAGRGLTALQSGRALGRTAEANQANAYDYLNLARTRTEYDRAAQELDQRKWAQDLQERSFGNAARASFLQNYTAPPSSLPPEMAQFSGPRAAGLESIPQATRDELGGAMYRNAITELLDPLQPGTAATGRRMAALPVPDPISPRQEATGFDDFLGWAGPIASGLSGIRQATQPPPTTTPPDVVPPRRSTAASTVTPGMQISGNPFREIPRATSPTLSSLSTPTESLYGPAAPSASQPTGIGSTLPSIASLVPEVPSPTAPLGVGRIQGQPFRQMYDEYGRPIRGGR